MPDTTFKIKLHVFDIFRNGIKEISFSGRQGAYNYICATCVNSSGTPMKSYVQVTRLLKKYKKFEHTDSMGTIFIIVPSILYK